MRALIIFIVTMSSLLTAYAAEPSWTEAHQKQLIQQFPEWKKFINDPKGKVQAWIINKNWDKVGDLIEANIDPELNRIIAKELFDGPAVGIKKDLQIKFIEQVDQKSLAYLVSEALGQPFAKDMKDLIRLVAKKGDGWVLAHVAKYPLAQPFADDMGDVVDQVIERGGEYALKNLVEYSIPNMNTKGKDRYLQKILQKTTALDFFIVEHVLLQAHTKYMFSSPLIIVNRATPEMLKYLAKEYFSKDHTRDRPDLYEAAIERSTPEVVDYFFRYTFPKEHTWKMYSALKLALSKTDTEGFWVFVREVLSQDHAKDKRFLLKQELEQGTRDVLADFPRLVLSNDRLMDGNKDLMRLFLEKAEYSLLIKEQRNILALRRVDDPNFDVITDALKIESREKRKKFLEDSYLNQDVLKTYQKSVFASNLTRVKGVSPGLKYGDVFSLEGRFFKVIRPGITVGNVLVYQVLEENKGHFALRVAKNMDSETLAEMALETQKDVVLQKLGVPHSKVVLQRDTYVMKTWVGGVNGLQLLKSQKAGNNQYDEAMAKLTDFIASLQAKGVDVDRITPADLIWNEKVWVIIDSGKSLTKLVDRIHGPNLCSKVF